MCGHNQQMGLGGMYKTTCTWQVCVKRNEGPGLVEGGVVDGLWMKRTQETLALDGNFHQLAFYGL